MLKDESMKVFRLFSKRVEVITFAIGFVIGIYMLIFFPAKYFVLWHALPSLPEPVAKISSVDHMGNILVDTVTNKKYECDLDNEKDCWVEVNYEPVASGEVLCFEDCLDNHVKQTIEVTGQYHNFGELTFMYSLRDDGHIYVKHTGSVYLPGYIMGVLFGSICAFVVYIGKSLFLNISSLFRRN